jgi:hypothetical protein
VQNDNNLLRQYTRMRKVFNTMDSGGGMKAQQRMISQMQGRSARCRGDQPDAGAISQMQGRSARCRDDQPDAGTAEIRQIEINSLTMLQCAESPHRLSIVQCILPPRKTQQLHRR